MKFIALLLTFLLAPLSTEIVASNEEASAIHHSSDASIESINCDLDENFTIARYDQDHQILMGPASIVDGCVNVISGSYFEIDTDLEVPGTNLTLTRAYSSTSSMSPPMSLSDYTHE